MSSDVALVKCKDYSTAKVEEAVRHAISLLGGIEKFVKPESKVLIKPNLLMAKEPESGIVTHPEVVRAVVRVLKDINARIYIGDSHGIWIREPKHIVSAWEKSGLKQVAEQEKVELVIFSQSRWYNKFPLTTYLNEVDYLVSLPKFKTHELTTLTGAIKNLYGLVSGIYKVELHRRYFAQKDFCRMLVDLYEVARPALTIVDGVLVLEGEGPGTSGMRRDLGLIVAGSDCVSIDSVLALIMGLKPNDILTTQEAATRNLGNARIEDIRILGEELSAFTDRPFKLPATTFKYRIPQPVIELLKKLIRFIPSIDSRLCSKCGACLEICPQKVIKRDEGGVSIDYTDCIACFCCQEVCPEGAISIKRSFLAKLLKL